MEAFRRSGRGEVRILEGKGSKEGIVRFVTGASNFSAMTMSLAYTHSQAPLLP
jgi:hypothetical protein